jgi:hypothetical protein
VYNANIDNRGGPPPYLNESHLCETHVQLGLLRSARVVCESKSATDQACASTRGRAYKDMVIVALAPKGHDEEI